MSWWSTHLWFVVQVVHVSVDSSSLQGWAEATRGLALLGISGTRILSGTVFHTTALPEQGSPKVTKRKIGVTGR